jgi:hypothetical protein
VTLRLVVSLLIVSFLFSCGTEAVSIRGSFLDPSLEEAYGDIDRFMGEESPPLLFDDGRSVNNLTMYIDQDSSISIVKTVNNMIVKSEYLVCDVLKIVGKSKITYH